jgi:hypothetical protein
MRHRRTGAVAQHLPELRLRHLGARREEGAKRLEIFRMPRHFRKSRILFPPIRSQRCSKRMQTRIAHPRFFRNAVSLSAPRQIRVPHIWRALFARQMWEVI